ncbi:peptidase [Methylosinus sp. C49]|uniref:PepSY-associated TM helix domain-containing protein n=1 Tax=Methylosinus sp. C49 TaxID=2699395 RepID=UPI001366C099|nr:PepSY-associated TM helix domain-containing protein [Methylosinus sp. C49]BBU62196.1 peptidase [Methylosinus sp. C49]
MRQISTELRPLSTGADEAPANSARSAADTRTRADARRLFVWLHRWVGLVTAGFLILVGLTGALLAFYGELSHWIAPEAYPGLHGETLPPAALARRAESLVPQARAVAVYLGGESGAARVTMQAAPGAEPLGFGAVMLDAVTGEDLGRRGRLGALPTRAADIMPFIYSLHYQLAMDSTGAWILGIVALLWTIDCFVAFYLTLPRASPGNSRGYFTRWKPAFLVKLSGSFYRINFDLHRAGGLWLWAMLLVFAWSSVFFNLNSVYTGVTKLVFDYAPPPWQWPAQPPREDASKMLEWEEAQAVGERLMAEQARERGFSIERADALYFKPAKGLIQYRVRSSLDIGERTATTSVLFDAYTGELVTLSLPSGLRSGDTVTNWLAALHMARVFGLPYRIFVCVLGLAITMLSVTGVYIWWKKRSAAKSSSSNQRKPDPSEP